MPKFFIQGPALTDGFLVLTDENAAHAKVLRLARGDEVTVCDSTGTDHLCTVSDISPGQVCLVVRQSVPSQAEPSVSVRVYMAYAKADKLEHVIQKATELGAAQIIAFPTQRCVSRPDEKALKGKLERWQKIAASAAGQCGRGRIPQVTALRSYAQALEHAQSCELRLFPYENEQKLSLRAALRQQSFSSAAIMTGPEGGFTEDEVQKAAQAGFQICTLGPRILRCETAPLCALTAVLFHTGDLD